MGFEEWANKNGYAGNFPRKEHMRKSWDAAYKQAIDDAADAADDAGLEWDTESFNVVASIITRIYNLKANLGSKG